MSVEDPCALDDVVLRARLQSIVKKQGIRCIVETGVYHGLSTCEFAKMGPPVIGIDNGTMNLAAAWANLGREGLQHKATLCLGNSPQVLESLLGLLPTRTLYFLDAHWETYWPLLDEIEALMRGCGVIVIHDCKVPDRPDLGFDRYGEQDLDYGYVKDALDRWCPTHRIEYNAVVDGTKPEHKRGVLYAFSD